MNNITHILITALMVLAAGKASAQDVRYWGSAGLKSGDNLFGFNFDATVFKGRNGLSLEGSNAEYVNFKRILDPVPANQIKNIQSLCFKYCHEIARSGSTLSLTVNSGISLNRIVWRGARVGTIPGFNFDPGIYNEYTKYYVGVPLGVHLLLAPLKYFGLGIKTYANLHTHPDYGITANLLIGKIK
jgi:hypothetical protein